MPAASCTDQRLPIPLYYEYASRSVPVLGDELCFSQVVVEGGPKAQKRYRKLLMQRIDWAEMADDDEDDDDEEDRDEARRRASQVCKLVWEGAVVKQHFKNFKVEAARSYEAARKVLKDKGCEHYFDMAVRFGTGEEEEDSEEDPDADDASEHGDADGEGEGEGEGDDNVESGADGPDNDAMDTRETSH